MRISRGGRYFARYEQALTPRRPSAAAAVRTYDDDGYAKTLVLDLDMASGGRRQVLADSAAAAALAAAIGARAFADESPSGGRHIYIPLATPRHLQEIRPVVRALRLLLPSLDISPMCNLAAGCIRPPGAAHPRLGGYQVLCSPLAAALDAVQRPNPDAVWDRLRARLAPQIAHDELPAVVPDSAAPQTQATTRRPLSDRYEQIARTAEYDTTRYATPSEARQAVITSAVARGWTSPDIQAQLSDGGWPGLATLYARYRSHWSTALQRDVENARVWITQRNAASRELVSHHPTSEHTPQGGHPRALQKVTGGAGSLTRGSAEEYRYLRQWWSAVQLSAAQRYPGERGLTLRAVLAAMGAAAQQLGSRYVAHGTRSLSLGAGVDPTTVAGALRILRAEPDPFIELLEDDRGPGGDLYQLRIPTALVEAVTVRPWPRGRIPAVDPVFSADGLGLPAHFVYQALPAEGSVMARGLQTAAGVSRAALYRALNHLADHGLARRVVGGWRRGRRALLAVRDDLDLGSRLAARHERFAAERRKWWAYLGYVPATTSSGQLPAPDLPGEASDDHSSVEPITAIDLLMDRLGAVLVPPDDLDSLPHPVELPHTYLPP
ncbi:hypothetical protein Ga0074812_14723 [Parafrankia irregularis]|uniref:MarR family protein n=1 Tax=Parafrankia irregularis TaxID=795642 RepID=A0A0S4QZZ2_9ACTN|nr:MULTISPECIES: hypothetical protein [Parafrankia]MBE3206660.1 hypothetical protein [Parafrankia sp. CH37]CUU60777.1 hypothetical protein Ga0074812_14723 [Parafrankia irregularis]